MNYLLHILDFMSEQNETERTLTIMSLIFLVAMLLYIILDSVGKKTYVPKNSFLKTIIYIMFFLVLGGLIFIKIYYK